MTLPKDVQSAIDYVQDFVRPYNNARVNRSLTTLSAHLLSMGAALERLQQGAMVRDAEIERLQSGLATHVDRVCELQSKLAAADALIDLLRTDSKGRKYHCVISRSGSVVPVDAHLSENTHG